MTSSVWTGAAKTSARRGRSAAGQCSASERPVPRGSMSRRSRLSSSGANIFAVCAPFAIVGSPGPPGLKASVPAEGAALSRRGTTANATVVVPAAGLARSRGTSTLPQRADGRPGTFLQGFRAAVAAGRGPGS
jgi:hypothetical protein